MRKIFPLSIGLVVGALVLSACDVSVTPVAARVNGKAISVSSLNAALTSAANDAGYLCYLNAQASARGQQPPSVLGSGQQTYAAAFVTSQLGFLADVMTIHDGLGSLGLATPNTVAQALGQRELLDSLAPQQSATCKMSAAVAMQTLDPGFRDVLIEYFADQSKIAAHLIGLPLTNAGIAAYEKSHVNAVSIDCIDAIIAETKASADRVVGQLQKGANFGAVAKANSLDPTSANNGGKIGCLNPSNIAAPVGTVISALKVGQISQPIPFGKAFVVAEVTSRSLPGATEAGVEAVTSEFAANAFSDVVTKLLKDARVEVSPGYGTARQTPTGLQITPLAGPKEDFVPNAAAALATRAS